MTFQNDDRRPMNLDLDQLPWQPVPEGMDVHGARAAITAGLWLLEAFHHHGARMMRQRGGGGSYHHLTSATKAAALRADIAGVMK